MPWSHKQRVMFLRACKAGQINAQQRYVILNHAGCPSSERDLPGVKRPSVKDSRNTQRQFELCMALAERSAISLGAGDEVPSPKGGGTWDEVASDQSAGIRHKINEIWVEARTRAPGIFKEGGLEGFIKRMTARDAKGFPTQGPVEHALDCDDAQLYRVLEGLKAWIGREFARAGLVPNSFELPKQRKRGAA